MEVLLQTKTSCSEQFEVNAHSPAWFYLSLKIEKYLFLSVLRLSISSFAS